MFESLRKEVMITSSDLPSGPSLHMLCSTRWTVWHAATESVLASYELLITTMDNMRQGHDEYAAKANGLLQSLESFVALFGLKLAKLILPQQSSFL